MHQISYRTESPLIDCIRGGMRQWVDSLQPGDIFQIEPDLWAIVTDLEPNGEVNAVVYADGRPSEIPEHLPAPARWGLQGLARLARWMDGGHE